MRLTHRQHSLPEPLRVHGLAPRRSRAAEEPSMTSGRWLAGFGMPIALATALLLVRPGPGGAETLQGQVLDAQTGQPIAGAIVLGVWSMVGGPSGLPRTNPVAVKEVEADAEGRFVLEAPGPTGVEEESVTVYKSGYIAWNNLFTFPTSEPRADTRLPSKIRLERFPPAQSHRRHVDFISEATLGKDDPATTPKFWKAVRPEYFLP